MEKAPEPLLPRPPSGTSEPGAAWAGAGMEAKGPDLRRGGPQARDVASAQFPPAPTGIPRLPCTVPQLWCLGSGSGFAHPAQTQLPAKTRRNQIGCLRNLSPPPATPGWLSWSPSPGSAPGEGRNWKLLQVSLPLAIPTCPAPPSPCRGSYYLSHPSHSEAMSSGPKCLEPTPHHPRCAHNSAQGKDKPASGAELGGWGSWWDGLSALSEWASGM